MDGQYDDDDFYILALGGFVDPDGYQFDKEGYDALGGYYDGRIYVQPDQSFEDARQKTVTPQSSIIDKRNCYRGKTEMRTDGVMGCSIYYNA